MTKVRKKKNQFHALRYHGEERNNGVAKAQYLVWRKQQQPPIIERCDNEKCKFFSEPLSWNGSPLPFILEHTNGVNTDNRPSNLRLLCPNCDAQNVGTKGGANAGRVIKSSGGFALVSKSGAKHYVLPAETGHYEITGGKVQLATSAKSS